jgi:hypothetical protein
LNSLLQQQIQQYSYFWSCQLSRLSQHLLYHSRISILITTKMSKRSSTNASNGAAKDSSVGEPSTFSLYSVRISLLMTNSCGQTEETLGGEYRTLFDVANASHGRLHYRAQR